jgi:predicted RNA-binding protein with EMAP domain
MDSPRSVLTPPEDLYDNRKKAADAIDFIAGNYRFENKTAKSLKEKDKKENAKKILELQGNILFISNQMSKLHPAQLDEDDWNFLCDYDPSYVHYDLSDLKEIEKGLAAPEPLPMNTLNVLQGLKRHNESTKKMQRWMATNQKLRYWTIMKDNVADHEKYKEIKEKIKEIQRIRTHVSPQATELFNKLETLATNMAQKEKGEMKRDITSIKDVTKETLRIVKLMNDLLIKYTNEFAQFADKVIHKLDVIEEGLNTLLKEYSAEERKTVLNSMISTAKDDDGNMAAIPSGYSPLAWSLNDEGYRGDWTVAGISLNALGRLILNTIRLPLGVFNRGLGLGEDTNESGLKVWLDEFFQIIAIWVSAFIRVVATIATNVIRLPQIVGGDLDPLLRLFNIVIVHYMVEKILAFLPLIFGNSQLALANPAIAYSFIKDCFFKAIMMPIKLLVNTVCVFLAKTEVFTTDSSLETWIWANVRYMIDISHTNFPPLDFAASGLKNVVFGFRGFLDMVITGFGQLIKLGESLGDVKDTVAAAGKWWPFGVIDSRHPYFEEIMKSLPNGSQIIVTTGTHLIYVTKGADLYHSNKYKQLKF